jgi:hypothetical protein
VLEFCVLPYHVPCNYLIITSATNNAVIFTVLCEDSVIQERYLFHMNRDTEIQNDNICQLLWISVKHSLLLGGRTWITSVCEVTVLMEVLDPTRWSKQFRLLHNDKFHNLYRSSKSVRMVKVRKLHWMNNGILVGKTWKISCWKTKETGWQHYDVSKDNHSISLYQ